MQTALPLTQDPPIANQQYFSEQCSDQSLERGFEVPNEHYDFTAAKPEELQDGNASQQGAVKAGPGRKSRACNECKRKLISRRMFESQIAF